ncbi:hypothetical protein FA13DRAFT_1789855 [Coprinellus micaceus]|uniref:Protein kinase domain-containing protein n=1 Tax=Coprinellus micaceus TaxID=71717 RepID=A0A4Y7TIT1_COPMI|nr:hypothetical protein FA13DRAFT_1789855 [Coprinellus micaceus]
MEAETLLDVLKILYDLLEVMRFLRIHRGVPHRDISKGNVMFVQNKTDKASVKRRHKELSELETKGLEKVCFIGHLLYPKTHAHDTNLLLVDFNNAEIVKKHQSRGRGASEAAGTPGFVASAVHKNGPLLPDHFPKSTWSGGIYLPETVEAPEQYQKHHPDRVKKFPAGEAGPPGALPGDISEGWRPDLDHEVESAYWALFYWLMSARPVNLPD